MSRIVHIVVRRIEFQALCYLIVIIVINAVNAYVCVCVFMFSD